MPGELGVNLRGGRVGVWAAALKMATLQRMGVKRVEGWRCSAARVHILTVVRHLIERNQLLDAWLPVASLFVFGGGGIVHAQRQLAIAVELQHFQQPGGFLRS